MQTGDRKSEHLLINYTFIIYEITYIESVQLYNETDYAQLGVTCVSK